MEIQAIAVRNQFTGQVKEIIRGEVLSEVDVQTPWGIVTSVITTRSVDDLQLTTGSNVVALVKSTEVSIATVSVRVAPKTHAAPAFPRSKVRSLAIDEAFGSTTVADSALGRRPLSGDPAPTPRSSEFLPAFYRLRDVMRICALSRTTIYHRIAEGRFPPPVHLGGRASGWSCAELQRWIEDPEGYRLAPPRAKPDVV
jgi:molybdopterin-binding protein